MEQINRFEIYLLTEKRVSRNTVVSYMSDIQQFADFLISQNLSLSSVLEKNIKQFLYFLKIFFVAPFSTLCC